MMTAQCAHFPVWRAITVFLAMAASGSSSAWADPPSLSILATNDLRFGTFAVMGNASRTITAAGLVSSSQLLPAPGAPIGPAQFTVSYTRPGNDSRTISVDILLTMGSVSPVRTAGIAATLSAFDTDLPGGPLFPGKVVQITIPNCTTRTCSTVFRVGGRLDLTAGTSGARLTFPLPMTATLVSAR
jgi:hypothetical protein